jgi:hypothetical protein
VTLLRLWFGGTAALILGFLVWTYAPILIPIAAVAIGLGTLTAAIVALARRFQPPDR